MCHLGFFWSIPHLPAACLSSGPPGAAAGFQKWGPRITKSCVPSIVDPQSVMASPTPSPDSEEAAVACHAFLRLLNPTVIFIYFVALFGKHRAYGPKASPKSSVLELECAVALSSFIM